MSGFWAHLVVSELRLIPTAKLQELSHPKHLYGILKVGVFLRYGIFPIFPRFSSWWFQPI